MSALFALALGTALAGALAAVASGAVLTRAVVAGYAALAAFALAALVAGAGFLALGFALTALLGFALVQVFGWMLVDIDHDHLPALPLRTLLARGLALAVAGGALVGLARAVLRRGELEGPTRGGIAGAPAIDPGALVEAFAGVGSEVALLLGLLLAAGLLTALGLLRDEGADAP